MRLYNQAHYAPLLYNQIMDDKYQNKYRIPSSRLQNWDYSSNGYYFITICTQNRFPYFGQIAVETQDLASLPPNAPDASLPPDTSPNASLLPKVPPQITQMGKIAQQYWLEIPQHFLFVTLGTFILMPNHIHGILIINHHYAYKPSPTTSQPQSINSFGPQSGNLASIVRGYKAGVKKYATTHQICFSWQSRYYDHIIRNEISYNRIRKYIQDNPSNWEHDKNYVS